MSLRAYKTKRNFKRTPEPIGKSANVKNSALHFVVHKHRATRLHYDLRLELGGVLKSWAIPKGPSLNPEDKRLAVMVEDHPYDYRTFEGVISKGNYGAGEVIIWDQGVYTSLEPADKRTTEEALRKGLAKGHISFIINGTKLQGEFSLVKLKPDPKDHNWLLIKKADSYASEKDITERNTSVVSGKTVENLSDSGRKLLSKSKNPSLTSRRPMLASLADKPFDHPEWLFEVKWDGYRAIAEVSDNNVVLCSRNFISFAERYPEIVAELSTIPHQVTLDGEIVVVDEFGRSHFQLLQDYQDKPKGTLLYYVFDILFLDGRDLTLLPLLERRKLLERIIPKLPRVRLSEYVLEHGNAFFAAAVQEGLEGIIAKRTDSSYHPGVRSSEWLKIKHLTEQEAVIGGFTEPRGGRKGLGALLLGVYQGNELIYIGHTGGGLTGKQLVGLREKLSPYIQPTSPFKTKPIPNAPVHWVEPQLVCAVRFAEWTNEGSMRQPIFLGLRDDLLPRSVHKEVSKQTERIFNAHSEEKEMQVVEGKKLTLTNLSKKFWPEDNYTKRELIAYYERIAPYILPYLYNRPQSLNRHPHGIHGESFYQKNASEDTPNWIERFPVESDSENRIINYILCNNKPALLYLANLGCIELNVWNSTIDHLDNPDYLVVDLDPGSISFEAVIETAQTIKQMLDTIEAPAFCKTSGKTGLHIYVPLGGAYTNEQVRNFAELLMRFIHGKLPEITSLERNPEKRAGKVYLDFLQNRRGQTMAAPYCLRPVVGAPVSTPLEWKELRTGLNPKKFTITTIFKRLAQKGDLWKDLFKQRCDIKVSLDLLTNYA